MQYTLHPVELIINLQRGTSSFTGGPRFNTTLIRNAVGDAQPQINQDEARWGFQLAYQRASHSEDINTLTAFHLNRRGMGYAFWLTDPYDHTDSDHGGTGRVKTIDGTRYLVKEYSDGWSSYYRIIRGAEPDAIVYDGVAGNPSYEQGTGIITGADSDGNATFNFRVPVAFTSDVMDLERNAVTANWTGVQLEEVRTFTIAS